MGQCYSREHQAETQGKKWVLLAAGSNGWENYCLQADVCHAYQMIHNNGIPDEQVVVMMHDDIANNEWNPHKGEIIHKPNGSNVYKDVPKDYTGPDITASNFLAVLCGDDAAVVKQGGGPKKVLKSCEHDTIFIFLTGHGGPGVFGFSNRTETQQAQKPNLTKLHADDLRETVKKMARAQKFSKMVIYINGCYSGSMIEHLPQNIQVYGVSASKSNECSYTDRYDYQRGTFLASKFSALWLDNCDTTDLTTTNFHGQFQFLVKKMGAVTGKKSTPCQHGNINDLSLLVLSVFLGGDCWSTWRSCTCCAASQTAHCCCWLCCGCRNT